MTEVKSLRSLCQEAIPNEVLLWFWRTHCLPEDCISDIPEISGVVWKSPLEAWYNKWSCKWLPKNHHPGLQKWVPHYVYQNRDFYISINKISMWYCKKPDRYTLIDSLGKARFVEVEWKKTKCLNILVNSCEYVCRRFQERHPINDAVEVFPDLWIRRETKYDFASREADFLRKSIPKPIIIYDRPFPKRNGLAYLGYYMPDDAKYIKTSENKIIRKYLNSKRKRE